MMKRWTLAALAATTLCVSAALAGAPQDAKDTRLEASKATRYAGTAERWRGRPALRGALAHPADEATASEKVYEHVPSVNFMLEGQAGGAFVIPRF